MRVTDPFIAIYVAIRLPLNHHVITYCLFTQIIEYSGEVIRHELCDKREKYYERKGIGCYMFRIDDNLVVDATMKGNAARFINHSCDVCMRSHFHPVLQRVILTIMFLLMFLLYK